MSIEAGIVNFVYEKAKNILGYSVVDIKFKHDVIDLIINNKLDLLNIFSFDTSLNQDWRNIINQVIDYNSVKYELNKKIIDLILMDIYIQELFAKSDDIDYKLVNRALDDEDLNQFLDRELRQIIRKNQQNLIKNIKFLNNVSDKKDQFYTQESMNLLDIYNFVEKYHDADHLLWSINDINSTMTYALDESAKFLFKIGIIIAASRNLEMVPVDRNKKTLSPHTLQKDLILDLVVAHQFIENKKNNTDFKYNHEITKNAQKEVAAILLLDILSNNKSSESLYENLANIANNYGDDCIVEMRDILYGVDNIDILKSKLSENIYSKYSQKLFYDTLSNIEKEDNSFFDTKNVFKDKYHNVSMDNSFSLSIEGHYNNFSSSVKASSKKNDYSSFLYDSNKIKRLSSNKLSFSGSPCLKPVYRKDIDLDLHEKIK